MESKEAAASSLISNPSSGSSSIKTSSFDYAINSVVKTNGLKTDAKSSSSSSSSSSDDEGFVSGEEEVYEMAPERPFVADPDEATLGNGAAGENTADPVVGSLDFAMPHAAMPTPMVSAYDDVEKGPKVGVEEIAQDGVVLEGQGKSGVIDGLGSSSIVGDGVNDSMLFDATDSNAIGVEEFVEKPKIVQDAIFGGDNVAENSKWDEVVISEVEGSLVADEVGVEGGKLKGEEAVEDIKHEALNGEDSVSAVDAKEGVEVVEKSAVRSADKSQVYSEIVKPTDSTLVKPDDVIFTTEGDSVVENIHVNLLEQGVVVIGEMEENKDSEIKDVEIPVIASVKLTNGSDQSSHVVEEAVGVDADFNKNVETNHNVESAESEVVGLKSDVTGACKDEKLDVGGVLTDNVLGNNQGIVEGNETQDLVKNNKIPEREIKPVAVPEAKKNETTVKIAADEVELVSSEEVPNTDGDGAKAVDSFHESMPSNPTHEAKHLQSNHRSYLNALVDGLEDGVSVKSQSSRSAEPSLTLEPQVVPEAEAEVKEVVLEAEAEAETEAKDHTDEEGELEGSLSDGETDGMIFGSSEAAKQFIEELERGSGAGSHSGAENFRDLSQRVDGQIVTDSDEEVDTDEEGDGKELFDSAALAALLKAATGSGSDSGNITISSQDGSRLFSVERPAGLGSSLQSLRPAQRPNRSNIFSPSSLTMGGEADDNLSEEEKKKLEQLQLIRVKFLRLVQRLGRSPEESIAGQVLYRLALVAGRQTSQLFSLDAAKGTAMQLEAEGKDDLNFSVNILVLGKSGVGKSATINSIFSEEKALIHAFEPATTTVKEICGMVDGVKIRVFDTPGLKSSVLEQAFNRRVLSSINKFTKKNPPDIVLYVDRLDTQTRDLNDLPLLRTITSSLGPSIWRSSIVTLTHAASAPPDGPTGSPLSYEVFVSQRSHVVQQSIGQAVGDLRMMSPSLMNPVSLVENHPSCRKNRDGQKVLPNGQSWRPQLLLLCYSMKILSEASSLSKPQDPFDHRKLFGFRVRAPPLPYMLSSMLQPRAHPKLADQGLENGDSDVDLADLSDSDQDDDEDEYDQLPPFKPLRKSQIGELSKEQRKSYFEEYDYRVKLLRKKQWREECKRMREIKKNGKDVANDYGYMGEDADQENFNPAPVPVPLPDMALPPSFDGDNPSYRYRFLEPTSQFLARPVLDTHGWDHDCGYDGVNLEQSLAIASQFPAAVSIQMTKDKKEFTIHLDSSVSAKHGENGSSMVGFDIQNIGKQLAYIVRGETKLKNLKKNKTAGGISVTFLGENIATGLKIEDQITLGKQWVLMGSAGTVRCQGDAAYGANLELQHRELDYPVGPVQSTFSMSLIKWRGDWAMGFNTLAQFSTGRNSKVAVRAGINNKLSGQITVRTSSSEHLSLALAGIIPICTAIYKKFWPSVGENYSIY